MPSHSAYAICELTPEERRCQVAAILVEGVLRFRRVAARAAVGQFSPPRDTGLEVLSETRLSVSRRFDSHAGDGRREVNDERNA